MATKKGPLGKVEIYWIEGHRKDSDAHQLARDLNRNLKIIQAYLEENEVPKGESIVSQQFAKKNGTVVMTENASQMTDAKRPHRRSGVLSSKHENCVTTLKKG